MAQRDNKTDIELIARIKTGDESAFASLFSAYAAALNDFAHGFVKSKDTSEDVVQDVFVRLWDKRAALDIRTSVAVYLYRVTRNAALDRIKHDRVAQRYAESNVEPEYSVSATDADLEGEALLAALDTALDTLPERAGEVLRLRIEHGLSNAEIAEVMGISVKGVDRARWRALEGLRRLLEPYRQA